MGSSCGKSSSTTMTTMPSSPQSKPRDVSAENLPERYYQRVRRLSISAEPISSADISNYEHKVIPKSEEAKARIREVLSKPRNVLFAHMETNRREQTIDAMFEKVVEEGETVIKQGDPGDNFYIVESGELDIFVARGNNAPAKVMTASAGTAFGELALMYNCPRAATVTAVTRSVLWALDRVSFQLMQAKDENQHRKMYEEFLRNVPILASLNRYERVVVSDALKMSEYEAGETVIRQGDEGDRFYIIEEGEAKATVQISLEKAPVEVLRYRTGDYFGEIALIAGKPRQANIVAVTKCKCVSLDRGAFTRLLGPCGEVLRRNIETYKKYESIVNEVEEANATALTVNGCHTDMLADARSPSPMTPFTPEPIYDLAS